MQRTLFALLALNLLVGVSLAETSTEKIAQEEVRRFSLSVELLGRGGLISGNFDYAVSDYVALGLGLTPPIGGIFSESYAWWFPLYANFYTAPGNSRFFVSAGLTPNLKWNTLSPAPATLSAFGTTGLGYEACGETGFIFRAALYAFFDPFLNSALIFPGVTFGQSF